MYINVRGMFWLVVRLYFEFERGRDMNLSWMVVEDGMMCCNCGRMV